MTIDSIRGRKPISALAAFALAASMCPVAFPMAALAVGEAGDAASTENIINITAPVAITFGGSSGYDVANPESSITSTGTFTNASDCGVYIRKMECNNAGAVNGSNGIVVSTDEINKPIIDQRIFGMEANGNLVRFGVNDNAEHRNNFVYASDLGQSFTIAMQETLECRFSLFLSGVWKDDSVSAKINSSYADDASSFQPLAKVKYTFGAFDPTLTFFDKSEKDQANYKIDGMNSDDPEYILANRLTDGSFNYSQAVYSAQDLKDIANVLSNCSKDNSIFYEQFKKYMDDDAAAVRAAWSSSDKRPSVTGYGEGTYVCNMAIGKYSYPLRIIGLKTDDKAVGADGTSNKAGITFQFVTGVAQQMIWDVDGNSWKGWGSSNNNIRNSLNIREGDNFLSSVPQDIENIIEPVSKKYIAYREYEKTETLFVDKSVDKFFLLSVYELTGWNDPQAFDAKVESSDGQPYYFWRTLFTNPIRNIMSQNTCLAATMISDINNDGYTALRTPDRYATKMIWGTNGFGDTADNKNSYTGKVILPAFCL